MIVPLRPLLLLVLAALASLALAACGGGSSASSDTSVDTLLKNTFSGSKKVKSGKLALTLRVDAKGAQGVNGPVTLKLGGPFQSQGGQKLPKFKIDFTFDGAGQSIKAGISSTGEKGFVNFQGNDYVVSDPVFKQFRTGYEQAQKQGAKQNTSLSTLGLNPRNWLTNARNAGDAKVGSDDTIKITGGVNVPRLLDDVNNALAKTKQLGVQTARKLPSQLTPAQKQQVSQSVKNPTVEIYTGKDDSILRRMVIALNVTAPKGQTGSAAVNLDFSISDVNKDQTVPEPSGAKPFAQLLSSLGSLGLGGLGTGSAGSAGSTGSSSGSGSGSSNKNLQKYSKCVTDAGGDATKARKCADLLTAP